MVTKPILAFDCACHGASIALMKRGHITSRTLAQAAQAAELIPAIDDLLRKAGVTYAQLGTIVTTVGPGSFTGLRIGLAALHGFVLVNATPIKTLTTLEAMAWEVMQRHPQTLTFYTALKAGKREVYAQKFMLDQHIPKAVSEITLYPETYTDWNAPCFGNQLDATHANYISGPDAKVLCAIAEQLPVTELAKALPIYIRPPDALPPAPLAWLTN